MRLETKFTLVISAVVVLLLGFGVALAPGALGDVRAWVPMFLVVSAATAYLCAKRLVCVPTQELAKKMWQVADSKSCDKPLCDEASRGDHLALPARAFNHLLETTSATLADLRGEKEELEGRIGAIEAELQSARTELSRNQEAREAAQREARQSSEKTQGLQQRVEAAERLGKIAGERGGFVVLSSPAPVFTMDTEGTVRSWNAAAERIFGWSAGECIGRPPVIVPEEEDGNEDLVGQLLEGQSFAGVQAVAEKKDGSVVNVTLDVAPARDNAGNVAELVVVVSGRVVGSAIAATVAQRRVISGKEQVEAQGAERAQVQVSAQASEQVSAQASEQTSSEVIDDGAEAVAEAVPAVEAVEQEQVVEAIQEAQPILKLRRDDIEEQNEDSPEQSRGCDAGDEENVATLVEVEVEGAAEEEAEVAVAIENNVYPRVASEWSNSGSEDAAVAFDADETLDLGDETSEVEITARATVSGKSKSRRAASARPAKKPARKAVKQQRAKARAVAGKRRQVA